VLARQLLLERSRASIPQALERMGCLQAQYAPSMYVGLWSRLEGLERDALTIALQRRRVVQGTLMRVTIHLVSKRDYWPLAVAIRQGRRELWLRARRGAPSAAQLAAAAKRLRTRLREGPLARRGVDELVGMGSVGTNGVGLWIDLVRVPPSGTWERRRADLYGAAEEWLGAPPKITREEAMEHLVRRYLGGFGPATTADIADWAGLPPGQIAPALRRLELRRFRTENGQELIDLPRAPLPPADTPAPVRFLPVWDATLLVHARRSGILPEEHRPRVFNARTPQSVATFLVDGSVAGTWRSEGGRIVTEPFGRLDAATRRELEGEAARLARFHL
jgi:hypothetical protein